MSACFTCCLVCVCVCVLVFTRTYRRNTQNYSVLSSRAYLVLLPETKQCNLYDYAALKAFDQIATSVRVSWTYCREPCIERLSTRSENAMGLARAECTSGAYTIHISEPFDFVNLEYFGFSSKIHSIHVVELKLFVYDAMIESIQRQII